MKDLKSHWLTFWWLTARFGLYLYGAVVVGVAYFISEKHKILLVLLPVFAAFVMALVIQMIVRRPRPTLKKTTYDLWWHTYSFPSGHATISFAFATSLSILFLNSSLLFSWVYVLAFFLVALLITISRIVVGVHYVTDVLAGALLGLAVSATLLGL